MQYFLVPGNLIGLGTKMMDRPGLSQENGIFHGYWKVELFRITGYALDQSFGQQVNIQMVSMGQQFVFMILRKTVLKLSR